MRSLAADYLPGAKFILNERDDDPELSDSDSDSEENESD